jgi:vacuolar-type H+-ATPase subunit H
MQEIQEESDFIKTIDNIKTAEEESSTVIINAKAKAELVLRRAKEEVLKERAKNNEKIVTLKNSMFRQRKDEIEKEVNKIIKKANAEAEKVKKEKMSGADISAILKKFLTDY